MEKVNFLKIESHKFVFKLMIMYSLIALGIYLILGLGSYYSVLGVFLIGAMFAHGIELQHQCIHNTGFANKKLNTIFGYLLGLPLLISYTHYKVKHLLHHAKVGTKEDSEFFAYSTQQKFSRINFIRQLFSLKRYSSVYENTLKSFKGENFELVKKDSDNSKIRQEYLSFIMALIATVVISIVFRTTSLIFCWIIPALFVAEPIHFLIEFPEHFKCDQESRDIFKNTRTISGSWFSFWFTNGNNYHVEHHFKPRVPIDKLNHVHSEIKPRIENLHESYFNFYKQALLGDK